MAQVFVDGADCGQLAVLLGGVGGLFFRVIWCRLKKRRSVP